jgi:hypothetical protein
MRVSVACLLLTMVGATAGSQELVRRSTATSPGGVPPAREQGDRDLGEFGGWSDYQNLFKAHPSNTFLIKASYWFSL